MDVAITNLLQRVNTHHGAAHWDEVLHSASDHTAKDAALALGLLTEPHPRLLVAPETDPRTIRARHFRGWLTCASAAEVLGLPMWHPPATVHIAVPLNNAKRATAARPLTNVHIHRTRHLTPLTVEGFPLVSPAEIVASCLSCLDDLDAVCVADAALHRNLVTKAEVAELLTGRQSRQSLGRLARADAASRSPLETRARLCLRDAGLVVETGVLLEGIGEVDMLVEGWLIVETDGYEFHSSREQIRKDRRREQRALADGYITVRLTSEDVGAGEDTILRIVQAAIQGVAHSCRVRLPENPEILRDP